VNSHIPIDHRFRPRPPQPHTDRQPEPVRTISSEALFQGRTEIAIEHSGSIYRLKITRQGKLILNK
jgi:hemin uptake protein HemP